MHSLNNSKINRKNLILFIFMAIFLFKGIFYAAYLTPLSVNASPDDVGHVSYVQYIYATKSLPVYGVTLENTTLQNYKESVNDNFDYLGYQVNDEQFDQSNRKNWIVQHPPTYYLLMTPFYALGKLFTNNFAYLILIMRLATLMLGVLSVFVVAKILDCLGAGRAAYLSVLSAYVFYAPIQFFFSNITNDSLTILLCLVALLFLLKFVYGHKKRNFYFFAISCGFIFMSKYTGALVIVVYLLFLLYKTLKDYNVKYTLSLVAQGIGIAAIIDGPYLLRNLILTGTLFPMGGDPKNYDYAFRTFLRSGYFDELFKNLTSLLGWKVLVQAKDINVACLALLLGVSFVLYLLSINSKKRPLTAGIFAGVAIILIPTFKYLLNLKAVTSLIIGFAVAITAVIVYEWIKDRDSKEATVNLFFICTIAVVFLFFIYKHFTIFNSRGHTGAMHGRYYYTAIFPMLFLIFNRVDRLNEKIKIYIPNLVLLFMASNELIIINDCLRNF